MFFKQEPYPVQSLLATVILPYGSMITPNMSLHDEAGQSFAEYAVILALLVVVAATGVSAFGAALGNVLTGTVNAIIAYL